MRQLGSGYRESATRLPCRQVGRALGVCLLMLLAGCQAPSAHPSECDGCLPYAIRGGVLTHQLLADSTVELTCRPLAAGWSVLAEAAACLSYTGKDMLVGRLMLCLASRPDPLSGCRPALDPVQLEAAQQRLTGSDLKPTCVRLLLDGDEALREVEQLIDRASRQIDVLMFMWDGDEVGESLARRLAARAGPNLRVRVLVDGGGNLIYGHPGQRVPPAELNRAVCWLARQPYVEVLRTRNPFARFDHRKLVLVDSAAAWTGGRNFTRKSFFGQHDLSFTLTGPLAGDLQHDFNRFWEEQGGKDRGSRIEDRGSKEPSVCDPRSSILDPRSLPNALARLVGTSPTCSALADCVYSAVDQACHHVYVENPYVTDNRLINKLAAARQRGADVRVVLTVEGNNPFINRANRVNANRLHKAGIRVYLHPGMIHVKAATVDGCWAYLGTGNFDPLSLRHNRELGLAVSAGPIIAELEEKLFEPDFDPTWELKEPLPLSAGDRVCELLASVFF